MRIQLEHHYGVMKKVISRYNAAEQESKFLVFVYYEAYNL